MAVVTVSATDTGRETIHWQVPPDNLLNQSPIPRGLREYGGSAAIAALGAGDETSVVISLTFPTVFCYQAKSLTISFESDDLTTEFSDLGVLEILPADNGALGIRRNYQLFCSGPAPRAAVHLIQTYTPLGTWRQWIFGTNGDVVEMRLSDISGDVSTAGDVHWTADFWEYDIEQALKWPVNTPMPMLPY